MDSTLKDSRMRNAVGVRELARRCGVSAATVVDWERSEAAGTIQSRTLRRALEAMGERLEISSIPEKAKPHHLERREQRLGLELHRAIAAKLISDPDRVLAIAHKNVGPRRSAVHGGAEEWVSRWEQLIVSRDLGGLVGVMLGTEQRDIDMRSVSPFTGLLTQSERNDIFQRANSAA